VRIFDDNDIVRGIKNNDSNIWEFVYKKYYSLARWKVKDLNYLDFSEDDIKDIFQDTMVIIYKRVTQSDFELSCSFQTFLFSICRIIILQRIELAASKNKKMNYLNLKDILYDNSANDDIAINDYEVKEEIKRDLFRKYFFSLNKICQKILRMFAAGVSYQLIADKLKLTGDQHGWLKKHQCKKQLIREIKKDKLYQSVLNN
jgi:RNA polymerase sigma factor (sigma-70 family)